MSAGMAAPNVYRVSSMENLIFISQLNKEVIRDLYMHFKQVQLLKASSNLAKIDLLRILMNLTLFVL